MAPRHMNHVDGDRDDKMRCDVALRDLGSEQSKVEPNDLAWCRDKSYVSQKIEHIRTCGMVVEQILLIFQ